MTVTGIQMDAVEYTESRASGVWVKVGPMEQASAKTGDVHSPQATVITAPVIDAGYSDEQFYLDIVKASRKLEELAAEAEKEHKEGRARKFPA